jgi:hypothetical protein
MYDRVAGEGFRSVDCSSEFSEIVQKAQLSEGIYVVQLYQLLRAESSILTMWRGTVRLRSAET